MSAEKIPTTAAELTAALEAAEADEKAAHARVVSLRACLRSRALLDEHARKAEQELAARVADLTK